MKRIPLFPALAMLGLVSAQCDAGDGEPAALSAANESPAHFRSDADPAQGKLVASLVGSALILIGGALAVWLGKHRLAIGRSGDASASIKVLSIRRITPRLTVVILETAAGERHILADNGAALLRLSGPDSSHSESTETPGL